MLVSEDSNFLIFCLPHTQFINIRQWEKTFHKCLYYHEADNGILEGLFLDLMKESKKGHPLIFVLGQFFAEMSPWWL